MSEFVIDGDEDYESPQFTTCKVRIGGAVYDVTPRDDRAMEAMLAVAQDLMDVERSIEALSLCLSPEDARDIRTRLAEGEADDYADDEESRVTRGKIRYVTQKVIAHYETEITDHFRSLSKHARGAKQPGDRKRPSAAGAVSRSSAEEVRRGPATKRKR